MQLMRLMTSRVITVLPDERLSTAVRLMWDRDLGALPVVQASDRRPIGMVTDRDICVAAWSRGRALDDLLVSDAMSSRILTCSHTSSLATAESLMRANKVRRLPVVDDAGQIVGMLALADLAQSAGKPMFRDEPDLSLEQFAFTISAICEPNSK
jgi:CBS-domain-containing membrane protein